MLKTPESVINLLNTRIHDISTLYPFATYSDQPAHDRTMVFVDSIKDSDYVRKQASLRMNTAPKKKRKIEKKVKKNVIFLLYKA